MRFVSICTLFVVVLTLTIHNVSASPVEPVNQGGQVNQGQNDLSKGANATCTLVDDEFFTKEEQDQLHKFLTDIVGPNVGCQVTNFVTKLSATANPCQTPAIKTELSAVLDSLGTAEETSRPYSNPQYNGARISNEEQYKLENLLPQVSDVHSQKMIEGVEKAISFPVQFFGQLSSTDSFFDITCS